HRALVRVQRMVEAGERDVGPLSAAGIYEFARESSVRLDYFEIVNPDTLDPVEDVSRGALVAVAAYVGATRLIDNILLGPAKSENHEGPKDHEGKPQRHAAG